MAHYCIFRTDRIGDLILTLPMAEALRQHDSDARVTFVVQEYTRSLAGLSPFVDDILSIPARDIERGINDFASILRAKRFDAAFFAYPRPGIAIAARRAGIPIRVGIAYRWYSMLFTHRRKEHRNPSLLHERDYNLRLLESAGISSPADLRPRLEIPEALRTTAGELLTAAGLAPDRPFVVLHPGSGGSARDWPVERFAALARGLHEADDDLHILVTGTPTEAALVRDVVTHGGAKVSALPAPVELSQLAAVMAEARLCVANSTGPLHLAAAVDTPVLGLYPFERVCHPRRWGPLGRRGIVLTPQQDPHCGDCASGACALHDDMTRISVAEATEAARTLIRSDSV
jgi:ADP-heptose:LPS heptosyltransferase